MFYLPGASLFSLHFLVFLVHFLLFVFVVVSTSASDCVERLISKMTYYASSDERDIKLHSFTPRLSSASSHEFDSCLECYSKHTFIFTVPNQGAVCDSRQIL